MLLDTTESVCQLKKYSAFEWYIWVLTTTKVINESLNYFPQIMLLDIINQKQKHLYKKWKKYCDTFLFLQKQ